MVDPNATEDKARPDTSEPDLAVVPLVDRIALKSINGDMGRVTIRLEAKGARSLIGKLLV